MEIGGYDKETDWKKLGPAMLIASCLVLAIRTAKWAAVVHPTASERDLEKEISYAIHVTGRVLSSLVATRAGMFPSKQVPWYIAGDEDVPK